MNAVLVGYKVKPEHVERNRELAEGFLRELSAAQLANRYAVFTLADDVSFVHLHLFADEAEEKQFTQLPSFGTFEKDLAERCEEPPAVSKLEAVGSYGWLDEQQHEPADLSRRNDWRPDSKTVIVRYKVKPEHAERNREWSTRSTANWSGRNSPTSITRPSYSTTASASSTSPRTATRRIRSRTCQPFRPSKRASASAAPNSPS